ncbi:hypothetical protein QJS04_geneDACA000404 [Acorus gramineus]|uniref:Uncharacterized protein n=1 Tax=Acorus gramineus TaxID=55184 RepID=A0AAV9ASV3_ACOGR|nr:hypothetical protein QJS04_geneDACA000404 [Acorus gramineus]
MAAVRLQGVRGEWEVMAEEEKDEVVMVVVVEKMEGETEEEEKPWIERRPQEPIGSPSWPTREDSIAFGEEKPEVVVVRGHGQDGGAGHSPRREVGAREEHELCIGWVEKKKVPRVVFFKKRRRERARRAGEGTGTLEGIARRILYFRRTFPDELSITLSSLLASKRPELPQIADSLTSRLPAEGDLLPEAREGEASKGSPLAEEDPEIAEKIDLFKAKIPRNAAVVPITLKRMNDRIAAINKLE